MNINSTEEPAKVEISKQLGDNAQIVPFAILTR